MVIIESILLIYFTYVAAYTFYLSAAGRIIPPLRMFKDEHKTSIAVLIPAYKEDAVIYHVTRDALQQKYPKDKFEVIVIADSLQEETLRRLRELPIRLIEVSFETSTKVKALNKALAQLPENKFGLSLILDADNLMEDDFLEKVNAAYQAGYRSIQGQRVAKNKNTNFAILDALSEIINNHIFRKGTFAAGGSSSLIGSGMAFDFKILKSILLSMNSVGGFDRELEVKLLEKGIKSCYLENARVYDEKVEKAEVFANQRKRWIASQFKYLRKYFKKGVKELFRNHWAYANSALLRNIQLPRVINLGLLFLICIITLFLNSYLYFHTLVWWSLLASIGLSFILAVPRNFYNREFFRALISIPKAFGIMLLLLFKLKGADKSFIHTPHSRTETSGR